MSFTIRSNRYTIFLGNDTFYQIGRFLSKINHASSRKFILADENTAQHCLPSLQKGVLAFQDASVLQIPAGENSKRIEIAQDLWQRLTAHHADRHSLLINLGGGVVGDIGGFVASTYMRGISFINIPTTLLAMVDASVGGKNGINFAGLKNHIGTFSDPEAVFVSPMFLKSLSEAELRCGFAEVIKHALISDHNKWRDVKAVESLQTASWTDIIRESIWTKSKIVNSDYRDRHRRKSLNFGHTIGHALESYSLEHHQTPLKHGEAVAVGMIGEAWLSTRLCGLNENDAEEIYTLIRKHFPLRIDFDNNKLIEIMKSDKKNRSESINFSLISNIGEPMLNQTTDDALIREALEFSKEQLAQSHVP